MTLGTRALKIVSGVSAVAVCGVSGVLVASDPKPAAAPLRPSLSGSSTKAAALVIPPSCGGAGINAGSSSAALDPSLLPVVQQLRQANTASERRSILAPLTASQRLAVEAYLHGLQRITNGTAASCAGSAATGAGSAIVPSVVAAPPSANPLISTYVS
ncbi:MAG: hypothetical protein WB808_09500 [Candidatus Dormiibacterota bacterium]